MSERLEVIITGQDGVSKTFLAVSRGAEQAGTSVEQAGKRGAQGMKELGREAQDSARKMDDIKAAATAVGAVFGVLATGAIKAGAAYKDQRLDIQSLEAQYGTAAEQIIDFTEVMQDSLNTSNDAARDVALTYATLYRNFDIGETQIQDLMQRTADISAARGRSAVEVSQMIQNALRGEGEYIEQIGVTLNDNFVASQYAARGMGEWTKVTDEAAKAAFRYQLLMEQTADTQGRAAEEAQRAGGQFRSFLNELQDAGQAVGGFLGPIGEVAAELAPIAMALPVVTAGLGRMVAAGRNSTLVMSALGAAFNPLTLGIGAAVGAGALLIASFRAQNDAAVEFNESIATLETTIENLRIAGESTLANQAEQIKNDIDAFGWLLEDAAVDPGFFQTWWEDESGVSMADASQEQLRAMREDWEAFSAYYEQAGINVTDVNAKITDALNNPNVNRSAYLQWIIDLEEAANKTATLVDDAQVLETILETPLSEIPGVVDSVNASLTSLVGTLGEVDGAAEGFATLADATKFLDDALADGTVSMADWTQVRADLNRAMIDGSITDAEAEQIVIDYANAQKEAADATQGSADSAWAAIPAIDTLTASMDAAREATQAAGSAAGAFAVESVEAVQAAQEAWNAAVVEGIQAWSEFNESVTSTMLELTGNADLASRLNLAGLGTDATRAADDIGKLAIGLDSVLSIFDQIDAMGARYDQAASIAEALVGAPGEWAAIDDLLVKGRISLEQYNDAVIAGYAITQTQAEVEGSLNVIRAKQLPLLQETTAAYQDYIRSISEMDAAEQAVALGWMDEGLQGRVQQVLDLSSQMDNLGATGEAAMQQVIDGITATDPVLTAMLENLGLITRELDGSYTFNLDAAGAMSDIERLTMSIDALTLALGGTPPTYSVDVTGREEIDATRQSIDDLAAAAAQTSMQNLVIDVEYQMPEERDWAKTGYTGGWEPIQIPATPVFGDGTGGPAYDGPAVDVPAQVTDIELPDTVPPLLVPVEPDIPVDFWDWQNEGAASIPAPDTAAAEDAIATVQAAVDTLDGSSAEITVTLTGADDATAAMQLVTDAAAAIPEVEMVNVFVFGAYEGASALDAVTASAAAIPEAEMVNVFVFGAYEAASALDDVAAAAANIPESVSTTITTNYVRNYTTNGTPFNPYSNGVPPGGMLGGVFDEFANGGVVIRAAEVGPEIAHFPMGGTALLSQDGLYNVPNGTYISPNNAMPESPQGGQTLVINAPIYGNVYGIDDMADALSAAVSKRWRGAGGLS